MVTSDKSFNHATPFVGIYFPDHATPSGSAQGSKRLAAWKQASSTSTFLKAITRADPEDEERLIGFAIWTLMAEAALPDREFMTRLWRDYVVPRAQAIDGSRGKGVYVLEMLADHPDYQRLGASTALAVVEGTPVARRLHEQCGLQAEIEEMHFGGDEFLVRRIPRLLFMRRDPAH
ncbi:hypothetical protein GGR53DRAFT_519508 [Hypoxylon sp. FL1150]|nr:hypothetical protein GGR53DRAFT_519508 [Hypoxylon sp. FL1150]